MNVPYQATLTVPKSTPENAPARVTVTPGAGFLGSVYVIFPAGVLGSVGVRMLEGGSQLAPMPSGWVFGNNEMLVWTINRRLQGPPYRIVLEGYSRALDWSHTITFRMEMAT